jgi:hypothetical protein
VCSSDLFGRDESAGSFGVEHDPKMKAGAMINALQIFRFALVFFIKNIL